MKGNVLGFDPDANTGAIAGQDGNRYAFVRREWRGSVPPARGSAVEFIAEGAEAREVYPASPPSDPRAGEAAKIVYILYLVGLIVGITAIVGVIIAYVNRADAPDWIRSHYRLQIRTFWIGLLYGLVSLAAAFVVVGFLLALVVLAWWIVRCAKGLQLLAHGEPYDNEASWLW